MHPLPRKHEMGTRADHDILDDDPRSIYFRTDGKRDVRANGAC